jgi:ATP-dependent 26S proteasome regulatory subunit
LLDRNVIQFARQRSRLAELGLSTKKGVLFYGPPGTGKTHTIHYLAGALEGHTTLLITAEQVAVLDEYMTLARLLQPSIVVIEDADLIARDRGSMDSPCEEALLNKLLNEMDGLRPDTDVFFILTTNRPEALEGALAGRPGRIDQAIEFPLPDDEGRRKLVHLYGKGLTVPDDVVAAIVRRTERVSASFIKELMRRAAQFLLERDGAGALTADDVDRALEELLFAGGSLNCRLLGMHQDGA